MNKEALQQVIENLEFPDAAFMPSDVMIDRYSFMIDLLGANTPEKLCELSDVLEMKIAEDSRKYRQEDINIYNTILAGNGEQSKTAYDKNERNKDALIIRILPFAFYVREKARSLTLDAISQGAPCIENGFDNIQRVLSKYHMRGYCSSIMILRGEKMNNEYVCGHPRDILFMLSAAIKGHLDNIRHTEFEKTIDDYLLELAGSMNLAGMGKNKKIVTIYPSRKDKILKHSLISQISNEIDYDYQKISKYIESANIYNTTYVICIKNQKNVKCLLGGDEDRLTEIFCSIINALIHSGYQPYERFNKVAIAIKGAFVYTEGTLCSTEKARV